MLVSRPLSSLPQTGPGLIFSPVMVAAILAGCKSVTRRLTKATDPTLPLAWDTASAGWFSGSEAIEPDLKPGSVVYIKENLWLYPDGQPQKTKHGIEPVGTVFRYTDADGSPMPGDPAGCWDDTGLSGIVEQTFRAARFMPRRCARLGLEVTDVRPVPLRGVGSGFDIDRRNSIPDDEAAKEGIYFAYPKFRNLDPEVAFSLVWAGLHSVQHVHDGIWVWRIEFTPFRIVGGGE